MVYTLDSVKLFVLNYKQKYLKKIYKNSNKKNQVNRNSLNKIVENSDPQELEDKIIKYTNEAIDDVMLDRNKNNGLENMRTSLNFLKIILLTIP